MRLSMITRGKVAVLIVLALIGAWGGWNVYQYFLDTSAPVLIIEGIEQQGSYAGDIQCIVRGSDGYKVHDISVYLDSKVLVGHHKINRSHFEYTFPIVTKTLPNGKHNLRIELQDGSYHQNTTVSELSFFVDNAPIQAALVRAEPDMKVFQGRTLHVQFQTNKEIKEARVQALSHTYTCVQEAPNSLIYECFIPIKSDETPNEYLLTVEIVDKVGTMLTVEHKFHVVMYPFKKQNLTLNTEKIKMENELGVPERQLDADIQEITAKSPAQKLWQGAFYIPCEMRGISTEFGTIRTTQERGKYPHNAIDLLGTPKSVVWAAQDGVIALKNRYAHSGYTVGIDHGCGVMSLYFHLDSMADVNIGDKIKKGQPVGKLGNSGYASGYHLHWEMRVNNIAVDPMQWTKHDF